MPQSKSSKETANSFTIIKYALRRISALLRLCHWPGSVRCYAQGLRSSDSPSVWPLEFLEKSSCHQALLLPWGISLDESWDRHVYQAMRDKAPNALYSFLVRSRNDTRASAPPEIVFPSRKVALVVPDFRFALGAPRARLVPELFCGPRCVPLAYATHCTPGWTCPCARSSSIRRGQLYFRGQGYAACIRSRRDRPRSFDMGAPLRDASALRSPLLTCRAPCRAYSIEVPTQPFPSL